jgi:single-stranded DNA-binding protein
MANQEIKLMGNIGQDLTFKQQGDRNLIELSLICEEYKKTDDGVEVREGTQNWYKVTVWGNPESLKPLQVLKKGMRIQVEGALKPSLFKKDSGEVGLSLAVNSQPSGVLIKPSRIEEIVMRQNKVDYQDETNNDHGVPF